MGIVARSCTLLAIKYLRSVYMISELAGVVWITYNNMSGTAFG